MSFVPGPRLLVLARHGQSEGNSMNIFTGWRDMPLTAQGKGEALRAGERLMEMGVTFDRAFSSKLTRASTSCRLMLDRMDLGNVTVEEEAALNERDYGELTGLNKDLARERFGAEQVKTWRRSYATAPPNGESLRDTAARVLPYYISRILPAVMKSRAVLVVAHGNSLRALILVLEKHSAATIPLVELATGELRTYLLGEDTAVNAQASWMVPVT
ncbi:2,3-bisphosphoglycerate-dependent phosphoglycerate mutase [soil metagenome]